MTPLEIILIVALVTVSILAIWGKMQARKKYRKMERDYQYEIRILKHVNELRADILMYQKSAISKLQDELIYYNPKS